MDDRGRNDSAEATGWQWIRDPSGHRWRVEGIGEITASLRDAKGRELNVGRNILREGFASGAWKMDRWERAR